MTVIETAFDGHRFRSRTEARWAVFFTAQTGRDTLLAVGPPRPHDQLRWFKVKPGEWDDDAVLWHFADDRRNEWEFWLLSESSTAAASIGPVRGSDHDRFPLVHAATRRAYDAAAGARFEHGETGLPVGGSAAA